MLTTENSVKFRFSPIFYKTYNNKVVTVIVMTFTLKIRVFETHMDSNFRNSSIMNRYQPFILPDNSTLGSPD